MRPFPLLILPALLASLLLGCATSDASRATAVLASTAVTTTAPSASPPRPPAATTTTAAPTGPDAPPRFTQTCGAPPGTALPLKLIGSGFGGWPGAAVFTSAEQMRKLNQTPPPSVDFTRERLVHWAVRQNPGARVVSVVETAQEIVIGTDDPAYCGGVPPPDAVFDLVIPASAKPVRIDLCGHGGCSGPPRP